MSGEVIWTLVALDAIAALVWLVVYLSKHPP